jgi:hypothetical protein
MINDPVRTQAELEQILRNAIQKGNIEYAKMTKEALDLRFPELNSVTYKDSRARPTVAKFKDETLEFSTSKKAYVWLLEKFVEFNPSPFVRVNWKTLFVAEGRKRNYFSQTIEGLFHGSPHLAVDLNNYSQLSNGWYANLNLNNELKRTILFRLAEVAGLKYDDDWSWDVLS